MKKELVIIAGSCYPINSATGGLAIKCAEYLDDYFNIRLISIQEGNCYAYDKQIKNFKLYTLTQWRLRLAQNAFAKSQNSRGLKRRFNLLLNYTARVLGRIESAFFTLDNMAWYEKKAVSLMKILDEEKRIDAVLSFCMPIESHFAAEIFKYKVHDVRWVSYWGDLFANAPMKLNVFTSIDKMRKIQGRLLKNSDAVLCTQEILNELRDTVDEGSTTIVAVPYVMKKSVLAEESTVEQNSRNEIKFVYMGAFYRDIRNPERMLQMFLKTPANYHLHMYSSGNCEDIIDKYVQQASNRIFKHKQVPTDELHKILKDADVLINVENAISNANPSKLIELISYRKPIVDFTYSDEVVSMLRHYPNHASINLTGSMEEGLQAMSNLVDRSKKNEITKTQIVELYSAYTEEKAQEIIVRTVMGGK